MIFRTHLVFGVFIGFLLLIFGIFNYNFSDQILLLIFLVLGIFVVDIDSRKSRIGRKLIFRPVQWFTKHRGMFHSLLFAVIVSYILYLWSSVAGFGFFIGYLSHLFLDVLTKRGVRLFWPFFKFKIGFGIKSGGLVEEVLFVLLLLADIWLGFKIVF